LGNRVLRKMFDSKRGEITGEQRKLQNEELYDPYSSPNIIIVVIVIIIIISVMQLGHLLTRSGLTCPKVSSKIYHNSFCQSESSVSLPWVIYYEVFCLHVVFQ
jgi:hypothetical protein